MRLEADAHVVGGHEIDALQQAVGFGGHLVHVGGREQAAQDDVTLALVVRVSCAVERGVKRCRGHAHAPCQ